MKYIILERTTRKTSMFRTIDEVIDFILINSNHDFIEQNGYIYQKSNLSEFISIIGALDMLGYDLIKILDILHNHMIDYRDVRNLHLENDSVLVVSTPHRTIKITIK
jgi:predicted nucleotidyltransferase